MGKPTFVPVNPRLVEWAINESGLSSDEVAKRVGVSVDDLRTWLAGKESPTKTQFARLAETLKRPTALFFLEKPPEGRMPSLSFRAPTGEVPRRAAPEERVVIGQANRIQRLLHWIGESEGQPRASLWTLTPSASPEDTAARVRQALGISAERQRKWANTSEALKEWRKAAENLGLVVLQESLGREGIRGFSIADELAPMVAINSSFSPAARIFSLFHEFGHLVGRHNYACTGFVPPSPRTDFEERWCEQFAAALLLPEDAIKGVLFLRFASNRVTTTAPVRALSNAFKVSARATALRLIGLGWATSDLYEQVVQEWTVSLDFPEPGGGGGLRTADRRVSELGFRPTFRLLQAAHQKLLTPLDAMRYLRVNLHDLEDLQARFGLRA